jgi:hypothetical protein
MSASRTVRRTPNDRPVVGAATNLEPPTLGAAGVACRGPT